MTRNAFSRRRSQKGQANPILVILLGAILLALLVLIVVFLAGSRNGGDHKKEVSDVPEGHIAEGDELPTKRSKPKIAVGDPDRIRENLVAGKTYEVVLNGGFDARVEDKDWGINEITNLAFAYEMLASRQIESNDGKKVVELRSFGRVATTKILTKAEVKIELGVPGAIMLASLDQIQPGTSETILTIKPIAETLLGAYSSSVISSNTTKAFAAVNAITGRKVRITYVDGEGVTAVEPVGCDLTADQLEFVANTAALSDCYILPDVQSKPGTKWKVDGSQLSGYFDPSMRVVPAGAVEVVREADSEKSGKQFANLKVEKGFLRLDNSDTSTGRVGTFEPTGNLAYNITDGHIESGQLAGRIFIEEVSKDHILFEARFQAKPTFQINYKCQMK